MKRQMLLAHRVAYALTHEGLLPEDLKVLHLCDHPSCCNPTHLRLGTQADNVHDAVAKDRMGKLTQADVEEIRKQRGRRNGRALAQRFGISRKYLSRVQQNKARSQAFKPLD